MIPYFGLILAFIALLVIVHIIMMGSVGGGWEGVVIYQGVWTDIVLDDSSEAAQVLFEFPQWPVTDSGYVVTDDETDVILYDDGAVVASGNWTLDGSAGSCTFSVAPTAASVISATFYFKETVGYWKGVDIELNNNIEKVTVGGQRSIYDLKEQQIEYSFKASEVYIDLRALNLAAGHKYTTRALPSLTAIIQTKASGGDQITLTDLKFDKAKLTITAGKVHGYDVTGFAIGAATAAT